jgi:methionyl-tRNA synthetase
MTRFAKNLVTIQYTLVCMMVVLSTHTHSKFRFSAVGKPRSVVLNSMAGSNFCVTTPIYYVNGQPHLGHAYTSVITDIIARFHRADDANVFFLTGTDEHGQKVEQSAVKNNKTPIEFADEVSDRFRTLATSLDCSHDDFIRTTEDRHKIAVQDLWTRLESKGQIYLGAYEGWYSIRDEAFYAEDEIVEGKAPTGAEVEWVREESYFFRLSDYTDKLLRFYDDNPDFIAPKGRRNEVVSFVSQEGGLRDLSVSRTTFNWGIPVPSDPKHVVYVWLDALTNYMSALGYPHTESDTFKQMWPASLHVVGKDILRFHAIFWPAFLMAADLEPPKVHSTQYAVRCSCRSVSYSYSYS